MIQKNIYELLNDVETDFTEYHEAQLLSDTDLKRLKKNVTGKIHRRQRLGTLAAAACAALFFGAFVIRPFPEQPVKHKSAALPSNPILEQIKI